MRSSLEHNSLIGVPDGLYSCKVLDSAAKKAVLSGDHTVAVGGDDKLWQCVTEEGAFLNIFGSTMVKASVVDNANIVGEVKKSNTSLG